MASAHRRTALLALVAVLAGCGNSDGGPEPSASAIAKSPDRFLGEEVTIESRVSNPIDHRVWEVAGHRIFVIYDRGLERGLSQGERLRMSGTVRPLERSVIEGELGINIEDHFFEQPFLDDDVALVAAEVTRLGRG